MEFISIKENGIVVHVHVHPGSKTSSIEPVYEKWLRIKVAARAVDGAANNSLRILLSSILGVSKTSVTLLSGEKSRQKTLFIEVDPDVLYARLTRSIPANKIKKSEQL